MGFGLFGDDDEPMVCQYLDRHQCRRSRADSSKISSDWADFKLCCQRTHSVGDDTSLSMRNIASLRSYFPP